MFYDDVKSSPKLSPKPFPKTGYFLCCFDIYDNPVFTTIIIVNRPDFPGECFICELRLPDHCFRWKHNELFLLLPEEYGPAFPA
ncbi:hypothetical protein FCY35_09080, partial [Escherichia coli]|nr:hypothetical protein [Escherichia coli]